MALVKSVALKATDDLFDLLGGIPVLSPRRSTGTQRAASAAVLAAADHDLAQAKQLLIRAHARRRTEDRSRFCTFALGRALDHVRIEAWAQRREKEYESRPNTKPQGLKARLDCWLEQLAIAIYRNIPGSYGWELAQSLTARSGAVQSSATSISFSKSLEFPDDASLYSFYSLPAFAPGHASWKVG